MEAVLINLITGDIMKNTSNNYTDTYSEVDELVVNSINHFPEFSEEIPVTEDSHPFSSHAYIREPLDLEAYGYVEEEYFVSGTANVYEGAESLNIKHEALPYKNRILVRKPKAEKFSGRVFVDIYNASNGYDIEDVWRRSYQYMLENNHIYIGVTAKPINVLSLKNFDYNRYKSLNWASKEPAAMPSTVNESMSIPGTEEGLVWDILSQLGHSIRNGKAEFLNGYNVENLYLTGQSQSGMYLNTYVYYFHKYLEEIFDGYLNVVGAGVMRELDQLDNPVSLFSAKTQLIPKELKTPFILLSSEGDINLFKPFGERESVLTDFDQTDGKIRHYELTSSPHTDPASPLIPNNSEIVKTKNPPKILDGEYNYTINDIQLAYYVNSSLEWLHNWAVSGVEPPVSSLIDRNQDGSVSKDEHGNATGGLRSPYIDVPIATYHPNAIADSSQIDQSVGNVNGSMSYFDQEKLSTLYKNADDYLLKFKESVDGQLESGWLVKEDASRMVEWSKKQAKNLFN